MIYLLTYNPVLAWVYAVAGCVLLHFAFDAIRVGYIYSSTRWGRRTNLRYFRDSDPWKFWLSLIGWVTGAGICFFLAFRVY